MWNPNQDALRPILERGIETVVDVGGKYYRAIVPRPEDFTIEHPILALWPDELTEDEAMQLWEELREHNE